MFWVGLAVGIIYVVSIVLAYAVGYGMADAKHTKSEEEL